MSVVIETTKGIFTVDLYIDERPKICNNFLKLCKMKYYNFCLFHSVQSNFLAQTGDPTGSGDGGNSIFQFLHGDQARFFECDLIPRLKHTKSGLLSMVQSGLTNHFGSQFFITLGPDCDSLDEEHFIFGEIVEGFEIISLLNEAITDKSYRPYQDIRITHTIVLHDPFDDPPELIYPQSPLPNDENLKTDRIAADETNLDEFEGLTPEEIEERLADKEAKARATILEMIGDLPDADAAPPENVLFVCKLNPVTKDEDLEIIFSRFGKVVSCEVIRDKRSGDSLQYAFVEFSNPESCEQAYFKMNNVLIDDRRIHVDFSQSVASYRWKGKGKLVIINGEENNKIGDSKSRKKDRERKESEDKKSKRNNLKNETENYKSKEETKNSSIVFDERNNPRNISLSYKQNDQSLRKQNDRSPQRKQSRSSQRRSKSPRRQNSRSPQRRNIRLDRERNTRSPMEQKCKSPRGQNSRSSPRRQNSRSPMKQRCKSPRRQNSRSSPRRQNSRSPMKQRCKSSRRQNSRSPQRRNIRLDRERNTRSPMEQRCKSSREQNSRSSPREQNSRSPIRRKSSSARKEKKRNEKKNQGSKNI